MKIKPEADDGLVGFVKALPKRIFDSRGLLVKQPSDANGWLENLADADLSVNDKSFAQHKMIPRGKDETDRFAF